VSIIHQKHICRHGLSQKETENEDQQAQAQETHAGEPPQEAFAL
jgi:hypothetical protein